MSANDEKGTTTGGGGGSGGDGGGGKGDPGWPSKVPDKKSGGPRKNATPKPKK
jgi:hypothetical protein